MATYTFVTEKAGSTIIEQYDGRSLRAACKKWHATSIARPGPFGEFYDFLPPVPITGTRNVWCHSGLDPDGVSYMSHVVKTQLREHSEPDTEIDF